MTTPTGEDTGRETAYERGLRHGGSQSGGGGGGSNFLTKPLGPLPLWAWLGLGLFAAIGYYVWSKHNAATSTNAATNNTSTGTATTDSALIPQFVNQVYTNQAPPETPVTTASGQGGSGGSTGSTGTGSTSSGTGNQGGSTGGSSGGSGGGTSTTASGTGGNTSTTNALPGYGQAGPNQNGISAITLSQAQTLISNKNIFNPSGEKSQRPFIWNGSAYVPATVIKSGYQYYAGPLEISEIAKHK